MGIYYLFSVGELRNYVLDVKILKKRYL